MVTVHIPAPLRSLTQGETEVVVAGTTLGEVVDALEASYPGAKDRLTAEDRIRPGWAVFIDSLNVHPFFSTRVPEDAHIYLAPAIAGG